jgi:hypothetical protein
MHALHTASKQNSFRANALIILETQEIESNQTNNQVANLLSLLACSLAVI